MYKILLCWRYLRTRFLALACIISVTLGVATLIVVNSVMSGFSEKLKYSLHKLISDIIIESEGIEGFRDPQGKMNRIMADPFLAEHVEGMSASLEGFAMLQFTYPNGEILTRPIRLIGIDAATRSDLGGFVDYLELHKKGLREKPDFSIPLDIEKRWRDREQMELDWRDQRRKAENAGLIKAFDGEPKLVPPAPPIAHTNEGSQPAPAPLPPAVEMADIKIPQGVIVGKLIAGFRDRDKKDPVTGEPLFHPLLHPGDSLVLVTVKGPKLEPAFDRFVVVDYLKTEMSEYDSNLVYVDLKYLQQLRAMDDGVTHIQIKLKDYAKAEQVVARLRDLFPMGFRIQTWEQKQGALLGAIDIEKGILNFLLFMIIAVAGFGILAIFSMIVAEKTRDIGIMKSLGASNLGVMQIFLTYGLLLGLVGSTLGTVLGVALTNNLNPVEKFLTSMTGRHIFDPSIYYFTEIPTHIETWTVVLVNVGAVGIAVVFSILPALRAAMLHPVRALRYE
ncbi:MAG: FtsX-like permease family protein [Planctomycetota bacterium]